MTAGEMRALLADVDDDVQIVVAAQDHEYRRARASVVTALNHGDGSYTQDPHDPDPYYEKTFGPRVTVLLIE